MKESGKAMTHVAVLDDYDGSISRLQVWQRLPADFQTEFFARPVGPFDLQRFDVLVANRERTQVDRRFLSPLTKLKHLALTGRLSGQADLEALKEKQVAVSFTEGSGQSAAELTIALILGLTKNLALHHASVREGKWQVGPATTLSGKTLGVLGLGRIGSKVARFGKLMDMKVVSWGPTQGEGAAEKLGVERIALDEVLRRSDVLAICLRLSEKTRGLLGWREMSLLKDGASLVNTARAEITERDALYAVLASGRIRAAFDVFHEEPLGEDDPMRRFPNVLLSPHMGYVTNEVYEIFFGQVVENILAWRQGRAYRNAFAPE